MLDCHWIDERGEWRKARTPFLDLSGPGQYAFRRLGLAKIGGYHPRLLQWDLKRVQPETMLVARKWLAESVGIRPVSLIYYFGGWFVERFNNGLEALDRIDRLNTYRDDDPPDDGYEQQVSIDQAIRAPSIRRSYELWLKDHGRLADEDAPTMAALAQHLVVYAKHPRKQEYHYTHIGHRSLLAQSLTPEQARKLIGKRQRRGPGEDEFDRSMTGAYRAVEDSQEPRFDHVCAPAHLPNRPRQWMQLERGLFPFQLPDGTPALASVFAPRSTVNIPFCP